MPLVDAGTGPSSPRGLYREIIAITADTTLTENHRDRLLRVNSGSNVTLTLPNSLPLGFHCEVEQAGAGQVLFSAASGATLPQRMTADRTAGQYARATLVVSSQSAIHGQAAAWSLAGDVTDASGYLYGTAVTAAQVNALVNLSASAAEHGAGAIGTAVAPATYRWTSRGVIMTQTKFDLTGLASVATANDVIGLAAGGAAYIGRNVVATNGVIYKAQLACLETPAGGDNDVNVVANSSAVLAYDGAGGTTYLSDSGDLLAGQCTELLLGTMAANDYFYLTAGTGDTAGTYTAGQYVLTTWGHALIS